MNFNNASFQNKAGIYAIRCVPSGKVYIGKSVNISSRFRQHKNLLRNNKHFNIYLQHAYNKYGEQEFDFIVLEQFDFVDLEKLDMKETSWYRAFIKENIQLFNILPDGGLKQGILIPSAHKSHSKHRECFIIKTPQGNILEYCDSVAKFCKEYNLQQKYVSQLLKGYRLEYLGWTLPELYTYIIYDNQLNKEFITDNPIEFFKFHYKLDISAAWLEKKLTGSVMEKGSRWEIKRK